MTQQEFKKQVRNLSNQLNLFFKIRSGNSLIRKAVDGSTFRVYQTNHYKPSSMFRTWADSNFFQRKGNFYGIINSDDFLNWGNEQFRNFHSGAVRNMQEYWLAQEQNNLNYGKASKLLDLLLKFYPLYNNLKERNRKKLVLLANCALDSYTLQAIRPFYNQENPVGDNIPANASMGFVQDEGRYWSIQNTIKRFCNPHPPIYFDIICWNNEHSDFLNNVYFDSFGFSDRKYSLILRNNNAPPQVQNRAGNYYRRRNYLTRRDCYLAFRFIHQNQEVNYSAFLGWIESYRDILPELSNEFTRKSFDSEWKISRPEGIDHDKLRTRYRNGVYVKNFYNNLLFNNPEI